MSTEAVESPERMEPPPPPPPPPVETEQTYESRSEERSLAEQGWEQEQSSFTDDATFQDDASGPDLAQEVAPAEQTDDPQAAILSTAPESEQVYDSRADDRLAQTDSPEVGQDTAQEAHSYEYGVTLYQAKSMGIDVVERPGGGGYTPNAEAGQPGQLVVDPSGSIETVRHDMRQAGDAAAAGWPAQV